MAFVSIIQVLAQAKLVTPDQFETWLKAWRVAVENGSQESLLAFCSREAGISEEMFLQRLAEALGWPFLELGRTGISPETQKKISTKVAFQYVVSPVRFEKSTLLVAVSNPFDTGMLQAVEFDAQCPVQFGLAPKSEIEKALKKYYGVGAETLDEIAKDEPLELLVGEDKEITEGDQEASVIKFVNQIIWEAYKDRSTDIHFEPAEDELRIRYRIDGILHQTPMPPQLKRYQAALISRIKVMSGMNIAEKRLPQDGRINVRIKGEEIDIRVSTVPTVYGESVSLRLLTRGKIFLSLDKLGFSPAEESAIREIIVKPHGIFLVTGPTGSGKSTSLYAFLSTINSVHKRIITIEEPVEYELKGINQIAVRSDIGLTFAVGLRHILRQDPNVIMVGEIRDLETAEIAIRAALTGHLVFSTLHTNDAPSAFTRLIDMGIEPFLVASSVEAVMAQRLVRTIFYSSGVGYFQRDGQVDGTGSVQLQFKTEDINDLLKSLVVQDLDGGQIQTVTYSSRDPLTRTLRSFGIDLTSNPTMGQILEQLRGEQVEVLRPSPLRGTILGVEKKTEQLGDNRTTEREHLNLLTDSGLQSLPMSQIQSIKLLNSGLHTELQQALQVLATSHDTQKKTVAIAFAGPGKRRVSVAYIAQTPIWKTSYRLVLDEKDPPYLQGWAIVENTSDEDWQNVRLSLVSGRPISFTMDLYQPL